ncbi:MAG: hypothetical protein WKG00_34840, partial [Polyangiaceae bacterium]
MHGAEVRPLLVAQLVQRGQPGGRVEQDAHHHPGRQPRRGAHQIGDRAALDVVHDQQQLVVEVLDLVHRNGVGVPEELTDAGLAEHAAAQRRVPRQVRVHAL